MAVFEATRVAAGRKNALSIELNGELGSLAFDLERLNELSFYDRTEPESTAGFRRILVTEPSHPYLEAWWPPGHVLGWEHTFVHQARDLLTDIAAGDDPEPSFADGLQVQRVLDAVGGAYARGGDRLDRRRLEPDVPAVEREQVFVGEARPLAAQRVLRRELLADVGVDDSEQVPAP